jgi:hypothetical protein
VARMAAVHGDDFPRDRVRLQRHPLLQERPCRLRPYNLTRFDNADDAHWREVRCEGAREGGSSISSVSRSLCSE